MISIRVIMFPNKIHNSDKYAFCIAKKTLDINCTINLIQKPNEKTIIIVFIFSLKSVGIFRILFQSNIYIDKIEKQNSINAIFEIIT